MNLRSIASHYEQDRMSCYSSCIQVLPFHESAASRRFIRGPNQVSKTYAGGVEAWAHVTGEHPIRGKLKGFPKSGVILVADLENVYPKICRKLHAVAPGHLIHERTRYSEEDGYRTGSRRLIKMKNGCIIEFAGGRGEAMSLASGTAGWLWIDEIPKPLHFGEAMRGIAVQNGPVWMTLTPIGRPVGWLRTYIEGDPERDIPPKGDWEQFVLVLEVEACTTVDGLVVRTAETIAKQTTDCPPGQEGQRLRGEWEGVSEGRAIPAFLPDRHILSPEQIAADLANLANVEIRLSWDHGEGTGNQICYLTVRSGTSAWVLDELVAPVNSTPVMLATAAVEMLKGWSIRPDTVGRAFGDVNSAGLIGGGRKYNDFLEDAFKVVLRLGREPFRIDNPPKGPGSVANGEAGMNTALNEGRYHVCVRCKSLIKSLTHYQRGNNTPANKFLKNALDAARYGMQDIWVVGGSSGIQLIV